MFRSLLLASLLSITCFNLIAQQNCGTPVYKLKYDDLNKATRNAIFNRKSARTATVIYTIPVVFHIMHQGEAVGSGVNLSEERIRLAIQSLNERYRSIPGTIGESNEIDMQVQFAIAVRDPDSNCTNGIERVDMTGYQNYMDYGIGGANGMQDNELKSITVWDTRYYANVWVVSTIDGYAAYSTYATSHGAPDDGVVIGVNAITGDAGYASLTHELGHYLNLLHVFAGGELPGQCPANDDCSLEGDLVCDTPPQQIYAPCEPTLNACTGEDLEATNFMSYSCLNTFTQGQKDRVMNTVEMIRTSLFQDNGNMALVPVAAPSPDFYVSTRTSCVGSEIELFDLTSCIPNTFVNEPASSNVSFAWTMDNNQGDVLTSADQDPKFMISAPGSYDVTLTVTTTQGTNSVTKPGYITVGDNGPTTASCTAQTTGAIDHLVRTDDIGIREVTLNDLHHISGTTIEDAANGITNLNGYGDFSCTQVANLEPFTEYTISVLLSDFSDENIYVFIDFDDNGLTYEDLVAHADVVPAGSGMYALPSFTTPDFPTFNKKYRMRIIDADSGEPVTDVCGQLGYYGQIQDYSVIFNDVLPVVVDDAVATNEDQTVIIDAGSNDYDTDGIVLGGSIDLDAAEPGFQPIVATAEGTWTYMVGNKVSFAPEPDFNGTATIQYTILDDRYATSLPGTITVTVLPVNDPPSFTKGLDQMIIRNSGAQLIYGWATDLSAGPTDESAQTLMFVVTNDNNTLFSVQPSISASGDLNYTPAVNAFGSAIVTVILKDDGGTDNGGIDSTPAQTFTIDVKDNSVPTITGLESNSNEISVYPNPFTREFTLTVPVKWRESAVTITDIVGRIVYEADIDGERMIDLSLCSKGMYLLRVGSGSYVSSIRIVLK